MTVELDFRAQLELLLELDEQEKKYSARLFESLQALFLRNAAKIQTFIVISLPPEWKSLISKSFSRCESLRLNWPSGPALVDLNDLPSLHCLHLKKPHVQFTLPWTAMTTLRLSGVSCKLSLEWLAKCPNLIEFGSEIDSPSYIYLDSSPSLDRPVVLEHLEKLTWSFFDDVWSSAFLKYMRFSKLRILKWFDREFSGAICSFADYTAFFSSLPGTLKVLEIFDFDALNGLRTMTAILACIPHLLELVLYNRYPFTNLVVINMIGRLVNGLPKCSTGVWGDVDPGYLEGQKLLPHLRKLTVMGKRTCMTPQIIAEMLEALHGAREKEHFRFELTENISWTPEDYVRLQRLAEAGIEFDVVLCSRPLDYMSPSVDVGSST